MMTMYREQQVFRAVECYAQYWHSNITFDKRNRSYTVEYSPTTPREHNYRSIFTSDRDRIMYTSCFLRLASKTQIFRVGNNDHLRTRLTHTLEVSQIARTIAVELGLNQELTEAIALGHDVGHTPFGHAGERQLDAISQNQLKHIKFDGFSSSGLDLKDTKGFKHNQQSVRVLVDFSHGISLTNYCLYGIRNHSGLFYDRYKGHSSMSFYNRYDNYCSYQHKRSGNMYPSWSFESMVVYWADEIAQRHHDIEDAYRSKLISKHEIVALLEELLLYFKTSPRGDEIKEFDDYCKKADFEKKFKALKDSINSEEVFSRRLSSFVVDFYTSAVIKELLYCIHHVSEEYDIFTHDDFKEKYLTLDEMYIQKLLKLDEKCLLKIADKRFKSRLEDIILPSYDVQRQDGKGTFITRKLFNAYVTNPQQLPDEYLCRIFKAELPRSLEPTQIEQIYHELPHMPINFVEWRAVDARKAIKILSKTSSSYELIYPLIFRTIFDYIAGMTDSYAQEEYNKLY